MKEVPLTQGYVALVDDEDFKELTAFKWHVWSGNGKNYYAKRGINGEGGKLNKILMHRQILNAPKEMEVDHINGNGLDNRRANLRLCSHAQNMCNQRILSKKKTSCFRGAFFNKKNGCWQAKIVHQGQNIHLGYFDREKDAALSYNLAASEFYGKFARLNNPIALVGANPQKRRRKYTGKNNPRAKLDEEMVVEIRMSQETSKALSLRFGVCVSTINRVRSKKTWQAAVKEAVA